MTKKKTKPNKVKTSQKMDEVKKTKKPPNSKTETVVLDAGKRYKVTEYIEFVKWIALPTFEREPETQGQFAKKYNVAEAVLSRWKNDDTFWSDVSRIRKSIRRDNFEDVVKGLYKSCIKHGRGQDVKVYAQLAGELKEDGEATISLSPLLEGAIAKINKHLPD